LFLEEYKYGDLAHQIEGVPKIRTIKYGLWDCTGEAQTRPLVREGATK
jgi:hypothetical protein